MKFLGVHFKQDMKSFFLNNLNYVHLTSFISQTKKWIFMLRSFIIWTPV